MSKGVFNGEKSGYGALSSLSIDTLKELVDGMTSDDIDEAESLARDWNEDHPREPQGLALDCPPDPALRLSA